MTESDYWLRLEYRLSREFEGMPQKYLRFRWCDGFTPGDYLLEAPSPRITGRAWIVNVQKQEDWEFTLLLNAPAVSRSAIDWASLLPPDNVTRWLAVDVPGNCIRIEPSAAVPHAG